MKILVGCILLGYLLIRARPAMTNAARWGPVLLGGGFALLGFALVRPQFDAQIHTLEPQNPVYSPMTEMVVFVSWVWLGILGVWGAAWGYSQLRRPNGKPPALPMTYTTPVEGPLITRRLSTRPVLLMAAVLLLFTAGATLFRSSTRSSIRRLKRRGPFS